MSVDTPINAPLPDEKVQCHKCGNDAPRIALLFKAHGLRVDHYYCYSCNRHFDITRIPAAQPQPSRLGAIAALFRRHA